MSYKRGRKRARNGSRGYAFKSPYKPHLQRGNNLRRQSRYYRAGVRKLEKCAELKFAEYGLKDTDIPHANAWKLLDPATFLCLNAVGTGSGESNRDGRVQMVRSLHIRGVVYNQGGETQSNPINDVYVKLAVILDKQTNKAQFAVTDIFNDSSVTTSNKALLYFMDLQNTARFRILWSKIILIPCGTNMTSAPSDMSGTTTTIDHSTGGLARYFSVNLKFKKPIRVNYVDDDADIGSIADKSLHLIGVGLNTPQAGTEVTAHIQYRCRVRFTD